MTLYSEEVKRIINSYPWPDGDRLKVRVEELFFDVPTKDGHTSCLKIWLYSENFATFDGVEQLRIAKIINSLVPRLNAMGIPTIFDVDKGDGRYVQPL